MLVEPASLCWLAGRKAEARDGATWATELERWSALTAVVRDGGTGLSKGIELVRARRREPEGADLEDGLDVFHTPREGGRALRATWAEASRALERAEAAQQRFDQRGRQGQSNSGFGAPLRRLWAAAERACARAEAAEAAWGRARSALELFTPEGRLNDRHRAEAVVTAALPDLVGASWAKVRRLLSRPEGFTFLDQAGTPAGDAGPGAGRPGGVAGSGGPAAAALAVGRVDARGRGGAGPGPRPGGAVGEDIPRVAGSGGGGEPGLTRGVAGEQPGRVHQQRGADAAVPAPEDEPGVAGPEAAVLEPAAVPNRPPQGSDAVRPSRPEVARPELLGVPQADPGGNCGNNCPRRTMRREKVPPVD